MRQFERVECILLHQEDAEPLLAIKSLDGPEYLTRDERRQPQRRLIQEQQPRAPHQGAGDRQHLLLAAGEGAAALVDTLLEPWKQLKHAFQVGLKMLGICQAGADLQVLEHAHAQENAPAFRRLRDSQGCDLVGGHSRDVAPGKRNAAFARARIAEDRHHQCRLAGTVGADQCHDLAVADFEVDAPQRGDIAVVGLDAANREKRRAHQDSGISLSSTPR